MRSLVRGMACAAAISFLACGRGAGTSDTAALQPPVSVAGCVTQSNGTILLTARTGPRAGAVGTSGTKAQQYRLLDDAHAGVDRWVNREVEVTGKLEQPRQEGAAPNATTQGDESLGKLPAIHVAQLIGSGDCPPAGDR